MKKYNKISLLLLILITGSNLSAETDTQVDEAVVESPENMPIISEKKLKKAAQVTILYSISEGKKVNSDGAVSW